MTGELKIMNVKAKDILLGDLILTKCKEDVYFVVAKGTTMLHKHKCIWVRYRDDESTKWIINELDETKTVCRLVGE